MTMYVDTSALLKRYIEEPDSYRVESFLAADPELVTGRHTIVEMRRNLSHLLHGAALHDSRVNFANDLASFAVVELDAATCELAATIAEQTGVRTLDALHLGAARRLGTALTFLTFDIRQAQAARQLGFHLLGI